MKRFRDREPSGETERPGTEAGEYYPRSHSEECAYAQTICSDGRSRPVREAEQGGESMPISRPAPYPTGGRSEPGQRY
jgi:hypothetical protein